jgi:phage-related holin
MREVEQLGILGQLVAVVAGVTASFFLPIAPYLLAIFCLVAFDTITGIASAKHRKEKIRANAMRRTVQKIKLYFIAIILVHLVEVVFFEFAPLTYIVASYIGIVELKSNFENIEEVTGTTIWDKLRNIFPHGKRIGGSSEQSDDSNKGGSGQG